MSKPLDIEFFKGGAAVKQRVGLWDRIADKTDLQGEPFPGQPVIELYGQHRVLIEHHRGVTEYGTERISVRMGYGYAHICGSELEVAKMTAGHLVIVGNIHSVMLCRGCKDG